MAHDVFISYAAEDKVTADALCARLEQHGIRCWIAPRDILPGRDWRANIVEAIAGARALVLMLSKNANSSSEIPKEILQATQKSLPIITFRIEDVTPTGSLSYELNSIHWLDAVTRPLERHIDTLAATLQRLLNVEAPTPAPPFTAVAAQKTSSMPAVVMAVLGTVIACGGLAFWFFGQHEPATSVQQHTEQPGSSVSPTPSAETAPISSTAAPSTPLRPEPPKDTSPRPQSAQLSALKLEGRGPEVATIGAFDKPAAKIQNVSSLSIVGCWGLPGQTGILQVRADGTFVSGGILNGTWSLANSAGPSYAFEFPEETGSFQISQDGTTLGFAGDPANWLTRVSGDPAGLVGVWRYPVGLMLVIEPDGTAKVASVVGKWKLVDQARRSYVVVWPGPKPILTISAEGNSAKSVDVQRGAVVGYQRLPC